MSDSFDDFIDGLMGENVTPEVRAPKDDKERFPCQNCGGTGLWTARRQNYRGNDKCLSCQGRGYFVTDENARRKARAKAAESRKQKKADARADNMAAIEEAAPGLMAFLKDAASWSEFAGDLYHKGLRYDLSDKQIAAAQSMRAKMAARAEAKEAAKEAAKVKVDLSAIEEMFKAALDSGYKKPAYRAESVRIKPHWKGEGLAVYSENRTSYGRFGAQPAYEGNIVNGAFNPVRNVDAETAPALMKIADNPLEAALAYGRKTGRCSCCGRELTNHASIDAGIGPICAQKWGL